MQKWEEKTLKKNWKNWITRLVRNPGLARIFVAGKLRLSAKKTHDEAQRRA